MVRFNSPQTKINITHSGMDGIFIRISPMRKGLKIYFQNKIQIKAQKIFIYYYDNQKINHHSQTQFFPSFPYTLLHYKNKNLNETLNNSKSHHMIY